jgi:hypothetical protein
MKESITKASHTSRFLASELQECYRKADPTQEIIVRQLLEKAVELEKKIKEFAAVVGAN